MTGFKKIKTALISVYQKDGLDETVRILDKHGVQIYSTGGTQSFIEQFGVKVTPVETLTGYPSILGGRVKTLHPKVFGGILARRGNDTDQRQMQEFAIPAMDLVIVDLYPFEDTVAKGAAHEDIIEKIDIGGISLIRAAAKNYNDVLIVPSGEMYPALLQLLSENNGGSTAGQRKFFATAAFAVTSQYDAAIFNYFSAGEYPAFRQSVEGSKTLRYGENPHQKGTFYGRFDEAFDQLHGKEISYNNLLDIDAAVSLIAEFNETTVAILKHNNACGLASRADVTQAWRDALAGDPVSAFGGIIVTNVAVTAEVAEEINAIFFEVIIAPQYDAAALNVLRQKKNRIILVQKPSKRSSLLTSRTLLNGVLVQERDLATESAEHLRVVTRISPSEAEVQDMLFANKIVKHSKSNAIVLAKNKQLLGSGVGQTSRVDALKHAIAKAQSFGFELEGAVLASDAFFPFADSVELAAQAGIKAVIQPGGSVRDNDSIDFCDKNQGTMVFTGIRHFKH